MLRNILELMTALAALVALFAAMNWASMPPLQRFTSCFFIAIVLHLWEEGRFPGGFTRLISEKLNFTQSNPHFGEMVTACYVLAIAFVPLFFPHVVFLALAPILLGLLEAVAHVAAIRLFRIGRPYSPGMATAVLVLLPLSIWGIAYVVWHDLTSPLSWLLSLLYLAGSLMLAQRVVVRASGMTYTEFLRNVRSNFDGGGAK